MISANILNLCMSERHVCYNKVKVTYGRSVQYGIQ